MMVTFSGREINLANPRVEDVAAEDIAHHLSYLNRFTGATTESWSVGQHSTVGSVMAEVIYPQVKWLPHYFQLHDATETWLGDVSSPLKSLLSEYRSIEERHRKCVEMAFAVSLGSSHEKLVDARMLATERKLFMPRGSSLWNDDGKEFTLDEFADAGARIGGEKWEWVQFWDFLWEPWEPSRCEGLFLDRMERLRL